MQSYEKTLRPDLNGAEAGSLKLHATFTGMLNRIFTIGWHACGSVGPEMREPWRKKAKPCIRLQFSSRPW
jgi:hypothetical protein